MEHPPPDRGSAPVETIFAIVFLMVLVLGVLEVTVALYGRNVIASAAHEGARAAIEVDGTASDAQTVAEHTVRSAAGALVEDLDVAVTSRRSERGNVVAVRVSGVARLVGPVGVPIPMTATATARRESLPP